MPQDDKVLDKSPDCEAVGDEEMQTEWCFDEISNSSSESNMSKGVQTADTETSSTSSFSEDFSYQFNSEEVFASKKRFGGFKNPKEYFGRPKSLLSTPMTSTDEEDTSSPNPEMILFGFDLTNMSPTFQFIICALGVFIFTILYGYLQELIQIQIAGRQFALFLGSCQFAGYAFWSAVLAKLRTWRLKSNQARENQYRLISQQQEKSTETGRRTKPEQLPIVNFLFLAILRAMDLGLTNLSMRYLNYPAKTLIKSSRVIFTMIMGVTIGKKKYTSVDYTMVLMLVLGLSMFVYADMNSSAIFHPLGVLMLVTSLSLDGAVSNWSEVTMNKHNLGQDEFQLKLYFFSFLIMTIAASQTGELRSGFQFFFQTHGTFNEVQDPSQQYYSWSIEDKTFALFMFSTLGIFGGSCASAITKRFGALAMSITTTTRKAATIFLSFALFPNACTIEHIFGVSIFVFGLLLKGGLRNQQSISLPKWLSSMKLSSLKPR